MTLAEARTVVEKAFPGEGVTLVSDRGACIVRHPKDGDIGRAFGWQPALQQACRPLLDIAAKQRLLAREQREADITLFMIFLKEKLDGDFQQWKADKQSLVDAKARAAAPAGDAAGAAPDQKQLVQVVPG